jgi:hypothetical protein
MFVFITDKSKVLKAASMKMSSGMSRRVLPEVPTTSLIALMMEAVSALETLSVSTRIHGTASQKADILKVIVIKAKNPPLRR